jgi:hypothetical protein
MTTAQTLLSYRAAVERHRSDGTTREPKNEPYIIVDGKWAAVNAALDKHARAFSHSMVCKGSRSAGDGGAEFAFRSARSSSS